MMRNKTLLLILSLAIVSALFSCTAKGPDTKETAKQKEIPISPLDGITADSEDETDNEILDGRMILNILETKTVSLIR